MSSNPTRWRVIVARRPGRILRRLPGDVRERIAEKLTELSHDPRPHGHKYMRAHGLYRVRVGDWRIIYSIEDDKLVVVVVRIAPRGGAYKNL